MNIMSVRAPDELREKLKNLASKQGLTRNALILQILWEWARKNQPKDLKRTTQEVQAVVHRIN